MKTTLFIDGVWGDAADGFASVDPSSGETIAIAASATSADVDRAVAAARKAASSWRAVPLAQRSETLAAFADALLDAYGDEGQETELKGLIVREAGRRLPEADLEVQESADVVRWYADNGPRLLESESLALDPKLWPTKRSRVIYEPYGVVAVIKPWNYPIELAVWALAPALLAGNTVVFKPSEQTPLCGVALVELMEKAGFPAGVVNLVTGDASVGEALVSHADVGFVAFTGSQRAGTAIAQACAKRLAPCGLELGGIDPAIVLDDADLELTSNGLLWGAFANAGQVCVRPKRIFVTEGIYDRLVDELLRKAENLEAGRDYGPMISDDQRTTVARQVSDSVSAGATLRLGGQPDAGAGFFFPPTVLTDVGDDMPVFAEECFGPVMAISRVGSQSEAIERANRSSAGLGASIWTGDLDRADALAGELEVGMVWINDVNVAFPVAPWGGRKASGLGIELGRWGLEEVTVKKHISREEGDAPTRDWWFPYE